MAEKKTGHWKFREANPTTGRPYFDWVPGSKTQPSPQEASVPTQVGAEISSQAPLGPKDRGNYTADIDSAAMEVREERKEATMRQARGLPPED